MESTIITVVELATVGILAGYAYKIFLSVFVTKLSQRNYERVLEINRVVKLPSNSLSQIGQALKKSKNISKT